MVYNPLTVSGNCPLVLLVELVYGNKILGLGGNKEGKGIARRQFVCAAGESR